MKPSWDIQNQVPLIPVWVHWSPSSHQHLLRLKGRSCVWGKGIKEQQHSKLRACSALVDTHRRSLPRAQMSRGRIITALVIIPKAWSAMTALCLLCRDHVPNRAVTRPWWGLPMFWGRGPAVNSFSLSPGTRRVLFNKPRTTMLKQPVFCSRNQFSFFTITHPREIIICNIYCNHSSTLVRMGSMMLY